MSRGSRGQAPQRPSTTPLLLGASPRQTLLLEGGGGILGPHTQEALWGGGGRRGPREAGRASACLPWPMRAARLAAGAGAGAVGRRSGWGAD